MRFHNVSSILFWSSHFSNSYIISLISTKQVSDWFCLIKIEVAQLLPMICFWKPSFVGLQPHICLHIVFALLPTTVAELSDCDRYYMVQIWILWLFTERKFVCSHMICIEIGSPKANESHLVMLLLCPHKPLIYIRIFCCFQYEGLLKPSWKLFIILKFHFPWIFWNPFTHMVLHMLY